MTTMKAIAYIRVSTKRQDYGLDAQLTAIRAYMGGEPLAVFSEKESGKNDARPELAKALQAAKREGAKLIVAKLDRLTRDAAFAFQLKNSGVDFVACDCPDMNTLTFGVMATMAQYERETIAQRTRVALQAAKARGVKLGSPKGFTEDNQSRGSRAMAAKAEAFNEVATRLALSFREAGKSLAQIAAELTRMGIQTARGGAWSSMQVGRLIKRAAA